MCGIVGVFNSNNPKKLIVKLLEAMQYRGPDEQGIVFSDNFAFGANRLWARGEKDVVVPAITEFDGNEFHVAFSGEIYHSHAGKDEVDYLLKHNSATKGMYAAASYSEASNELQLFRDQYGIKPVYYQITNSVIFASEISTILQASSNDIAIDPEGFLQTFVFGNTLSNKTVFKDINKVLPNELVKINLTENKKIDGNQHEHTPQIAHKSQSKDVRELLRESIKQCLDSQQTIGLSISGGLDSTILAYELNDMGIENISTVSLKVEGSDDGITSLSDIGLAKGGAWETWHHSSTIFNATDFPRYLKEAAALHGQPYQMTSYPLYLKLADLAKSANIKVLLSGEGADELFVGYKSYLDWLASSSEITPKNKAFKFYVSDQQNFWLHKLFNKSTLEKIKSNFDDYYCIVEQSSPLKTLMTLEARLSLEPLLLRTDSCLMSRSIEGRMPYLHAELEQIISASSDELLLSNNITKPFLRNIYKDCIDSFMIPKRAFRAPIKDWFLNDLKDWVIDTINNGIEKLIEIGFLREGLISLTDHIQSNNVSAVPIAYKVITTLYWYQWLTTKMES